MIVKFLGVKNGGGLGSVNYVLNKKRVADGTAKILLGNEKITRDLIKSISKKQKVSFGVMSFEESNIPEHQKFELMKEFEKTFMAGLNQEQYNILWVEHTDKGRLELNCIIPKIELSTGRAFNPYFHGSDLHLADLFQTRANLKYGFTDPKDPSKQSIVQGSRKEFHLIKDYQELDKKLVQLVRDGIIEDRESLISMLGDSNIKVNRIGTDYISVKLPDSKKAKRFEGGVYDEQFTSIEKLSIIGEEKARRERAYKTRDREAELRKVESRFTKAVQKRANYNRNFYSKPKKGRERVQNSSNYRNCNISRYGGNTSSSFLNTLKSSYQEKIFFEQYGKNITTDLQGFYVDTSRQDEVKISNWKKHISIKDMGNKILSGDKNITESVKLMLDIAEAKKWDLEALDLFGTPDFKKEVKEQINSILEKRKEYDRVRGIIATRTEERARTLSKAREQLEFAQKRVREQLEEYSARIYQHIESDCKPVYNQAKTAMREQRERRSIRERFREAINSVREGFEQFETYVVAKLLGNRAEFESNAEESENLTRAAEKLIDRNTKEVGQSTIEQEDSSPIINL